MSSQATQLPLNFLPVGDLWLIFVGFIIGNVI